MSPSVTVRAATEQDDAFLYELYKSVRMPEFAHMPLPSEQFEALMQIQYAGQKFTFAARFPSPCHHIILIDGRPAGRIWMYLAPAEHRLVDIALLPEHRNRGIGGALLRERIVAAAEARVPLKCSVAANNPGSLRFHQRLGFQIVEQDDVYYELALQPA